mmetsp:Transcript_29788/g.52293  ORF Transcript_29788/g.52293 Transcript_29788/m.52293 type:complete len:133 (+) Transcript_29788:24-422(+)|eukprot:CAMPEP_0197524930 /NCGR_PEP_ID=MMETSP1318-20131121/10381_1 /TAXON_ID=552666 /ORGANISM="Partenskyella glossopodia, Strain RCC365" /LENGTH=132 /DNA_ID=CAMNT_0043078031 /DNA_START=18 /DNA_END=416 /DNA_ORIENTATION=+
MADDASDEKSKAAGVEYQIRPAFKRMFKPSEAKVVIRSVLEEMLADQTYEPQGEAMNKLTRQVSQAVKQRLKELPMDRYKIMVQVVIGENKGAGVRMGCRCFWDAQTDRLAKEEYSNDHLWATCVAFGVYLY